MGRAPYIVTFRLGTEVVTSRHKALKAARKATQSKSKYTTQCYCIYRRVG